MRARRWRRSTDRSRTDPSAAAAAIVDCVGIRSLALPSRVTWVSPDSGRERLWMRQKAGRLMAFDPSTPDREAQRAPQVRRCWRIDGLLIDQNGIDPRGT